MRSVVGKTPFKVWHGWSATYDAAPADFWLPSFRTPEKMTLHDAQLIEKLFFGRHSIGYLTRGTMKSYGPAR